MVLLQKILLYVFVNINLLTFALFDFLYEPGVNVAPPGNDDRVGGIAFTVARPPLPLDCLLKYIQIQFEFQFNAVNSNKIKLCT